MISVSPDFEINMLNQKEMQSNGINQFSSPVGQKPKHTCRTLRTGSGNPTPPFQQGSELSTGNGLQSSKPGNTT